MNSSTFNILFIIAALFACLCVYTSSTPLFYAYAVIVLLYSVFNIKLGLMVYLLIAPMANVVENESLNLVFTPIFLLIYLNKIVSGKVQTNKIKILFAYAIIVITAFFSSIFSGYMEYIHVAILFILTFSVSVVITNEVKTKYENVFLIANSFITAGMIATVISFLKVEQYKRLALGDSIRDLANILGLGFVLLSIFYFSKIEIKDKIIASQFRLFRRFRWPIIIILTVGLVTTISRGAILAVAISMSFYLSIILFRNFRKIRLKWFLRTGITVSIVIIGAVYFMDNIFEAVNFNSDVLFSRFSDEEVEGGTGIRQKIWMAGISGLEGLELLYGHGYSSFRMLASKNGYDYYSHSPFVDTLVTTGILGLMVLLSLFYSVFRNAIKHRSVILGTLLIYLCLNYLTHGSMRSMGFWLVLGLCTGIGEYYNKQIKIRKQKF